MDRAVSGLQLKTLLLIATLLLPMAAEAGSSCTSYKSGSYTKTYCSHSRGRSKNCTSYMSGSYPQTKRPMNQLSGVLGCAAFLGFLVWWPIGVAFSGRHLIDC